MAIIPLPVYNNSKDAAVRTGAERLPSSGWLLTSVNRKDMRLESKMIVAIQTGGHGDGLRPVYISRDLPQVVDLLRMVFGESSEAGEQKLFGDIGLGTINGLIYRLQPSAARLSNGFVWQADGRIVGNATLLTTRAWDRYLVANVAVHPSYRRQGIARAMMESISTLVRNRGGHVVLLQVVKDNHSAIDLYRSLGYESIANMTTWYATASRIRNIPASLPEHHEPAIEQLPNRRWREAYALDISHVQADLNWPEPLTPDAYRYAFWQRASDFLNGRQRETWSTTDAQGQLTGLASIHGEWGHSYYLTLRVRPGQTGQFERPLLAKLIRRLHYLPRRNARIDHPEADEVTSALLQESNFTVQRTLTHMRLNISR